MSHKPHLFEGFPHYFESLRMILHYSCNAPSEAYLKEKGFNPRGEEFSSGPTEVVEIPLDKYRKLGYKGLSNKNLLKINCEKIMRDLGKKENERERRLEGFFNGKKILSVEE